MCLTLTLWASEAPEHCYLLRQIPNTRKRLESGSHQVAHLPRPPTESTPRGQRKSLPQSDLTQSEFIESDLTQSELIESDLTQSELTQSDLIESDLIQSDLHKVNS